MVRKKTKHEGENAPKIIEPEETLPKPEGACANVEEKDNSHGAWLLAVILGAMVIIALGYAYSTVTQKNMLKSACSEISNSPDLKYPTACVPLDEASNSGDYIDQKSNPVCRCKVDLGDGNFTVIDVRLAK